MRQGSPYLLVDESLETGDNAPTTELGVLSHDDSDEERELEQGRRLAGGASNSAPLGGGGGAPMAARFTLHDSDDEEGHAPDPRGSVRPPAINVQAAQQAGVVVEALPTPVTPAPPPAGVPQ